jgi:hypothetical protein
MFYTLHGLLDTSGRTGWKEMGDFYTTTEETVNRNKYQCQTKHGIGRFPNY